MEGSVEGVVGGGDWGEGEGMGGEKEGRESEGGKRGLGVWRVERV